MPANKRPVLTPRPRKPAADTKTVLGPAAVAVDPPLAVVPPVQPVMAQAHRDVQKGLLDTDCYTRIGKLIRRSRGT